MFQVKNMTPEDFPFAIELANTLDWNMGESDFKFNSDLEPEGCLILFDNSDRIGIATCINYGQVGWFGNLAVKEEYRKRGAGTLLVKTAVRYLKSKGVSTIGLYAYPHLLNFYRKIGFKPDAELSVLRADSVSAPFPPIDNEKLKPFSQQEISQIVAFDAVCFGATRKKLLESLLSNKNNLCYFSSEEGKCIGYSVAKVFDGMAEVGPLICKKNHVGTAESLLNAVLSKLEGFEAYLYLPKTQASLMDVASKAGFEFKFSLVRMFLGPVVAEDCVYLAESLERG